MKDFFKLLADTLEKNTPAVLCTIIKAQGSTPRDAGAMMAVFPEGKTVGSVGGGAVEYQCSLLAATLFEKKSDTLGHFVLTAGQAADIGMICGGDQDIYLHYLPAGDINAITLARAAEKCCEGRQNSWLFTRMAPDGHALCDLYTREDGFILNRFSLPEAALPANKAQMADGLFIRPISRSETVYVFGAGHVARALVPLLVGLDFAVVVYDQRPELARAEDFPGAVEVICASYENIFARIDCREGDYAVVMTPGHEGDLAVQKQLLTRPPRYIGVIGSHRKAALQRKMLEDSGVSPALLQRIHSPVGLPIHAGTPAEIAVSIAAEMISIRNGENS